METVIWILVGAAIAWWFWSKSDFSRRLDALHDYNKSHGAGEDAADEAAIVAHDTTPAAAASAAGPSIPEQIKQLAELRDAGILTDDEFETKKTALLAQM